MINVFGRKLYNFKLVIGTEYNIYAFEKLSVKKSTFIYSLKKQKLPS